MTVLAVPEALPAALLVTYRLFLRQGPLARQTAIERLAPTPEHPAFTDADNKTVKAALMEGLGMGLLVEEDDLIRLAPAYSDAEPTVRAFRQLARKLILDPANSRNQDLVRALAWFLTLDPYQAPASQVWSDIQMQHPEATTVISNDIRWTNFQRWAHFLGFAEPDIVGRDQRAREVLMPAPTLALLDCWSDIRARLNRSATLSDFLAAAGNVLPVLDPTQFARDRTSHEQTLPASLSLALLELQDAGYLKLEDLSDTDKWRLHRPDGRATPYSHVTIQGGLSA